LNCFERLLAKSSAQCPDELGTVVVDDDDDDDDDDDVK